jgi:hypothetical protein
MNKKIVGISVALLVLFVVGTVFAVTYPTITQTSSTTLQLVNNDMQNAVKGDVCIQLKQGNHKTEAWWAYSVEAGKSVVWTATKGYVIVSYSTTSCQIQ